MVPQIERFAAYEGYGANYELVQRDIEETQRAMATWPEFDRAIEILSAHVNPVKSREANRNKALTIKDLLIKVGAIRSYLRDTTDKACTSPSSDYRDMS